MLTQNLPDELEGFWPAATQHVFPVVAVGPLNDTESSGWLCFKPIPGPSLGVSTVLKRAGKVSCCGWYDRTTSVKNQSTHHK